MFEYFYHEILRRTIISFGSIFNGIDIKHLDSSGNVDEVIKVPLATDTTQKVFSKIRTVARS